MREHLCGRPRLRKEEADQLVARRQLQQHGPSSIQRQCPESMRRTAPKPRREKNAMRKQYSLRPAADGFDAWDVDRLVRLARALPIERVPLDSIAELDEAYWFAAGEEPTVRNVVDHARLIGTVDVSFPVILDVDGRVMDGMHRIARALLDGHTTIRAVRFDVQPEPDHRNCRPDELPY